MFRRTAVIFLGPILASAVALGQGTGTPGSDGQPQSHGLTILSAGLPIYPLSADENKLQGPVQIKVKISETGAVESAEVVNGAPPLAEAATAAVKLWKFSPFVKDGSPKPVSTNLQFSFLYRDELPPDSPNSDKNADPLPNAIRVVRISPQLAQKLVTHRVQPAYPNLARMARIQGTVLILAFIGKDGAPENLHIISGHPLLATAALDATKQWRYKPFAIDREPVRVQTTIAVNFVLN
jgi:TonB family protein